MAEKKNGSHPAPGDDMESANSPMMARPLFDQLTEEQRAELLETMDHALRLRANEDYSGPLVPVPEIAKLERIAPGSADRILAAYESRERHRMDIAERLLNAIEARASKDLDIVEKEHISAYNMARVKISASIKYERRGQLFAFLLTMATLLAATQLISAGQVALGLALLALHIGAMAAVFVYGWRESRARLAASRKDDSPPDNASQTAADS